MHLVIISGAARPQVKSNTAKIIAAFQKGYEECGNTTEAYYLSDRRQWEEAEKAFQENTNILIVLPLYVENKLSLMNEAYQQLLGNDSRELLDISGCADTDIFWSSEPVESVEAVMRAAGLQGSPFESVENDGN